MGKGWGILPAIKAANTHRSSPTPGGNLTTYQLSPRQLVNWATTSTSSPADKLPAMSNSVPGPVLRLALLWAMGGGVAVSVGVGVWVRVGVGVFVGVLVGVDVGVSVGGGDRSGVRRISSRSIASGDRVIRRL